MENQKTKNESNELAKICSMSKTDLIKYIDSKLDIEICEDIYNDNYFEDMTHDELIEYVVNQKYKAYKDQPINKLINKQVEEKKRKEESNNNNDIPNDEFILSDIKNMSPTDAKKQLINILLY